MIRALLERLKGAAAAGGDPLGEADAGSTRPFAPFEWMIAWRYLRPRRRQAAVSVIALFSFLGIMIGVAALITVMAVMNGFRDELISKILGFNGHILVQATDAAFTDYGEVSDRVSFVPGVTAAIPFIDGQALASGPRQALGAIVRGMRKEDLDRLGLVSGNVQQGTLDTFKDGGGVAVGSRLARSLGLQVGDQITIVTPRGNVTPLGVTPRVKSFPIMAIFQIGMTQYDNTYIFMPLGDAQNYFNLEGRVSAIDIYVSEPDRVGEITKSVEIAAQRPVLVTDWRYKDMTFFSALEVERNAMFMILTLIVLVAALNIVSGLTMLVKDKTRDIAILRTMGATSGAIMRIFFIAGSSIGATGTLAGFLLGMVLCRYIEPIRGALSWLSGTQLYPPEVYFLTKMRAVVHSGETVSVIVMALILSLLATIPPSRRAAKLDPVEALRNE
jgi:lipoprotein-releasing system permease protein